MKTLLLIPLALVAGAAVSDVWSDGKGLVAKSSQSLIDHSEKLLKFTLVGNVDVVSASQSVKIDADSIQFNAKPNPKDSKAFVMETATATGHVIFVKTATSPTGKRTTRIDGSKGNYIAGTSESTVRMAGPMKIETLDERQRPTMVATGSSGVASVTTGKQSDMEDALRVATMEGPVQMDISQVDAKTGKLTKVHATSDRMVFENLTSGRKVTLIGSVNIKGIEGEVGELSGAPRAVFMMYKNGDSEIQTGGK